MTDERVFCRQRFFNDVTEGLKGLGALSLLILLPYIVGISWGHEKCVELLNGIEGRYTCGYVSYWGAGLLEIIAVCAVFGAFVFIGWLLMDTAYQAFKKVYARYFMSVEECDATTLQTKEGHELETKKEPSP